MTPRKYDIVNVRPFLRSANTEDGGHRSAQQNAQIVWLYRVGIPVRSGGNGQISKRKIVEQQSLIRAAEREKL